MATATETNAIQFNGFDDYLRIVEWMRECGHTAAEECRYSTPEMSIQTSTGTMSARPGDWIKREGEGFVVQKWESTWLDKLRLDWLLTLIWDTSHRDADAKRSLEGFKELRRAIAGSNFPFRDAIDRIMHAEGREDTRPAASGPSREWLRRAAKAEDSTRSVSVGGDSGVDSVEMAMFKALLITSNCAPIARELDAMADDFEVVLTYTAEDIRQIRAAVARATHETKEATDGR